ncbi:hypothetical protein C0J52_25286 [Blattella germanica]|nr:hypothetical protein C0J52_25286 [Blattella germanica]
MEGYLQCCIVKMRCRRQELPNSNLDSVKARVFMKDCNHRPISRDPLQSTLTIELHTREPILCNIPVLATFQRVKRERDMVDPFSTDPKDIVLLLMSGYEMVMLTDISSLKVRSNVKILNKYTFHVYGILFGGTIYQHTVNRFEDLKIDRKHLLSFAEGIMEGTVGIPQKMAERKETMATGGGPSRKDDEEDNYLRKVESVVPHLNLRVNSVFDSDGFIGEENRDIDVLYDEIVEVVLQHSETENETTLEKVKVDNGETPKKKLKKEVNPRASIDRDVYNELGSVLLGCRGLENTFEAAILVVEGIDSFVACALLTLRVETGNPYPPKGSVDRISNSVCRSTFTFQRRIQPTSVTLCRNQSILEHQKILISWKVTQKQEFILNPEAKVARWKTREDRNVKKACVNKGKAQKELREGAMKQKRLDSRRMGECRGP